MIQGRLIIIWFVHWLPRIATVAFSVSRLLSAVTAISRLPRSLLLVACFSSTLACAEVVSIPGRGSCTYQAFGPTDPLPTPPGWTAPASGQTQPTPPPTSINNSPAGYTPASGTYTVCVNTALTALYQVRVNTTFNSLCTKRCKVGPPTAPAGWSKKETSGAPPPCVTDGTAVLEEAWESPTDGACPAGYRINASSVCNLTSAPAVVKPTDGFCNMIKDRNTFKTDNGGGVNGGDPDCNSACAVAVGEIPFKNAGNPCPGAGNPINPATGNKNQIEAVYTSSGDFPLALTLEYNQVLNGWIAFGGKWKSNYQRSVTRTTVNGFVSVSVVRADGKATLFLPVSGAWATDADTPEQLVELKSGATTIGWKYTNINNETENYDANGKLTSIANRAGLTQTLAYDASNRLAAVTDAFGRTLSFTYGTGNRVATMTDPALGLYSFAYDTAGGRNNLISITYPDTKLRTFLYENASYTDALTGIIDENNSRYATYIYDTQGKAISTEHAGAVDKYSVAYNADGSSVITDPLNTQRTYNFTTILGAIKSTGNTQPAGAGCAASSSAMSYDANNNVSSRTDFNGYKTTYVYDLTRNLETSRTEGLNGNGSSRAESRTITTAWDTTWRLPTLIEEYAGATATGTPVKRTTLVYDAKGNLTSYTETDPALSLNRTTTITYTYSGTVPGLALTKVVNGPRTDVTDTTTYHYYAETDACVGCRGQLKDMTDALGHTTQFTSYNLNSQLLTSTDPNGLVTTNTYDVRQRLTSRTVGTETIGLEYYATGQLKLLTLPDSSTLTYTYDAAHRLTAITDNLGNSITYTLDAMGNRITEDIKDPQNTLIKHLARSYDALNRLQTLTGVGQE